MLNDRADDCGIDERALGQVDGDRSQRHQRRTRSAPTLLGLVA
jgi:hypothetical protein